MKENPFLINFVLSEKAQNLVGEMNHEIARALIELHYNPEMAFPLSCVDLTDYEGREDVVSFIPSEKVDELIKADVTKWRRNVWTEKRSQVRIGKLVKQLFGDRFPINLSAKETPKRPYDIESFVNQFKSVMRENHAKVWSNFEVVRGKDIAKWYRGDRYVQGGGTINSSCLRHGNDSLLDMYRNNPDQIYLLILREPGSHDYICGRALLWKLDTLDGQPTDRTYMDRVYTRHDSDVMTFHRYAEKNGWLYKSKQTFGPEYPIVDPTTGKSEHRAMTVKFKNMKHEAWPYVDTLSVFDKETGILHNDPTKIDPESKRPITGRYYHLITYEGRPGPRPLGEGDDEPRMTRQQGDDEPRMTRQQGHGRIETIRVGGFFTEPPEAVHPVVPDNEL